MNHSLYSKITNPDTCRENLRGVFLGPGYLFATDGFIAVFEQDDGETDFPIMKANRDKILSGISNLEDALEGAVVSSVFSSDLLLSALGEFSGPVKISVSPHGKGNIITIEDSQTRIMVMGMDDKGNPPRWKAAAK